MIDRGNRSPKAVARMMVGTLVLRFPNKTSRVLPSALAPPIRVVKLGRENRRDVAPAERSAKNSVSA